MTKRRWMLVLLGILEFLGIAVAYYFGGLTGVFLAIVASGAAFGLRQLIVRYRGGWTGFGSSLQWDLGLLSYQSEVNLTLGAVVDLSLAYVLVLLIGIATHTYLHPALQIALVLVIAVPKYLWSTNLFRNHILTFNMGVVTFLERIVPSGPEGKGLKPGYYWLPLGWPFYILAIKKSVKEFTIPFDNMQVWTQNSPVVGRGAISGRTDGTAQFEIVDLGQYSLVETPEVVLEAIVLESARDVCERRTIEAFIAERNDTLAAEITEQINITLATRTSPLGVRLKSVNVKRTDNESEVVKAGWSQINVQVSTATARATDAAARIRRIKAYTKAGVDANRAAALDAVASDKAGATVGDQRYNVDVGDSLKGVAGALVQRLGG